MNPIRDNNSHGLVVRCVYIPRHQNGFGFTLRHFIVYPPEVYVNDGTSGQQTSLGTVTEPVDTIFVKSVRENGPAARAGLCVGDRVVSVNGEPIAGKSYDQVVHLIQLSPSALCLEVTPKQYDTLQLFYEEKAYRPETNQRPHQQYQQQLQYNYQHPPVAYSGSGPICIPVKHYPPLPRGENCSYFHNYQQQLPTNSINHQNVRNTVTVQHHKQEGQRYGSYNSSYESVFVPDSCLNTVVENMSAPPTNFQTTSQQQKQQGQKQAPLFSHLPRPTPYKSTVVWSHLTTQQQQSEQQQPLVQKQTQKYYQKSQPQTYYPFNQRGPALSVASGANNNASGAKSHESILAASAVESLDGSNNRYGSMECLPSGAAGNTQDQAFSSSSSAWKNTPGYRYSISAGGSDLDFRRESTISLPPDAAQSGYKGNPMAAGGKVSLKEMTGYSLDCDNMMDSSTMGYERKMADRIRLSCEQKEEFLKRPNQPLIWAPLTPNSSAAAGFPKELYAQPKKFQSVPWPPPNIAASSGGPNHPLQQSASTPSASNISQASQKTRGGSADSVTNRTTSGFVEIGSESDSGGGSSWNYSDYGSAKNRLTVVGSGKLHCDPPPDWKPPSVVVSTSRDDCGKSNNNNNNNNNSGGNPSNDETDYFAQNRNELLHAHTPVILTKSMPVPVPNNFVQYTKPRSIRPNQLILLPSKFRPSSSTPHKIASVVNETPSTTTLPESRLDTDVILRKREIDPENENDRLVRRVSYLKATSSPIDMDNKSSNPSSPIKSCGDDENDDVMVMLNLRKSTTADPGTSTSARRRSVANKLSSDFLHKGRIVRLKQFFEERTQPSSLFKFHSYSPSTEFRHFGSYKSERGPDESDIIKDGPVHFKVRAGENKKVGFYRSWRQGWAQIRRSGCLYLSKERITRDPISSLEDNGAILCIGLKNGISIEPAEDYSTKRKNVLRLKTTSSSPPCSSSSNPGPSVSVLASPTETRDSALLAQVEILIQADDVNDLTSWLKALQQQQDNNNYYAKVASALQSAAPINSSSNGGTSTEFSPKSSSIFKSISSGFHSVTTTSTSASATTSSNHHLNVTASSTNPTSPKTKTWKGKVANKLKKHMHIGASPATQSGFSANAIPEGGATFGVHLEDCPPGEINSAIPRVMEICINTIESRGLCMVGIYRIPGNSAAVSALTDSLNKGNEPNAELDPRWNDVHVISSMLKSFLRNLPDPLLTSERYADFIRGVSDADDNVQFDRVKALIDDLPEINYETLRYLILHLKKVSENSEKNRMESKNLSIVFGPTLVRPAEDSVASMVNDMKQQCRLVELLINHAYEFFPPREQEQTSPVASSSQLPSEAAATTSPVPVIPDPVAKFESDIRTSLIQAAQRKVSRQNLQSPPVSLNTYGLPASASTKSAVDESGHIRSYASLGAETEQRVRQFELETRAILTRDGRSPNPTGVATSAFAFNRPASSTASSGLPRSEEERLRFEKLKVEAELRKAKDDMENEDFYDQLADNPSSIIHHREYGLPSFPILSHNVSSSSVSSSNSASGTTADVGDMNMISSGISATTWPIKLGPAPFRPSQQGQSLPPKPPNVNVGLFKAPKPIGQILSSPVPNVLRKVNSVEQLNVPKIQAYVAADFDNSKVTGRETLTRLKKPSEVQAASPYDSKICGSLDSLRDIVNGGSREDISLRSSNGSDLVVTMSRELDQKLEALRPKAEEKDDQKKESEHVQADDKEVLTKDTVVTRNNGISKGRSRSMIDHRGSDVDKFSLDALANGLKTAYQDPSLHRVPNSGNNSRSSPGDRDGKSEDVATLSPESQYGVNLRQRRQPPTSLTKEAKTATNRMTQSVDNRKIRRHSLSGTADILRLAFDESVVGRPCLAVSPTSGKNLSSDTLTTTLPANSILESHV